MSLFVQIVCNAICMSLLCVVLEILLPDGAQKRAAKTVISLVMLYAIAKPIISLFI